MNHRINREIQKITLNPPFGISCNFKEDSTSSLEACVAGVPGTPFEKGVFELELNLTDKYPFQPPQIKFVTPVYHPNIDNAGRICMDLLKMPPSGTWRPTITIEGLLTAIQSLLANPNPDDPLVPDIAEEFKYNRQVFEMKARKSTEKYASQNKPPIETSNSTKKCNVLIESNDSCSSKPKSDSGEEQKEKKCPKNDSLKRKTPDDNDDEENVCSETKRRSLEL